MRHLRAVCHAAARCDAVPRHRIMLSTSTSRTKNRTVAFQSVRSFVNKQQQAQRRAPYSYGAGGGSSSRYTFPLNQTPPPHARRPSASAKSDSTTPNHAHNLHQHGTDRTTDTNTAPVAAAGRVSHSRMVPPSYFAASRPSCSAAIAVTLPPVCPVSTPTHVRAPKSHRRTLLL